MTDLTELDAWQQYALHLAHCRACGSSAVHCAGGQILRDFCFEGDFDEQPFVRDPELRRAALEVVCRMERLHAGGTDDDFEQLGKAVDALKEALAK